MYLEEEMDIQEILISIIIPIYNAENYIDLCLKSILNQVNDSIEVNVNIIAEVIRI